MATPSPQAPVVADGTLLPVLSCIRLVVPCFVSFCHVVPRHVCFCSVIFEPPRGNPVSLFFHDFTLSVFRHSLVLSPGVLWLDEDFVDTQHSMLLVVNMIIIELS